MDKINHSKLLAALLALALALSTGIIVLADDAYGMQGAKKHLQMISPSDITVNSATDTEYVDTLNAPVALTDGKASFQFKMDGFGGQITNQDDKVSAMQNKVNNVVAISDASGNAVTGSAITVTAVDTDANTFDLAVSGLAYSTSYILIFPSSFTTGGDNWTIGANIKFNFNTTVDPEAPSLNLNQAKPAAGVGGMNANLGYAETTANWEEEESAFEFAFAPKKVFATQYAEDNYKLFSMASYYGDVIPVTVGPGRDSKFNTYYKVTTVFPENGWYCVTAGKDIRNDSGKAIGDYTGGKDQTFWILKPNIRIQNGNKFNDWLVDLTTNLQNINYEDNSAFNSAFQQGKVAMNYEDITCPDYLVKLTVTDGYVLPATISISVNGRELTPEKDYSYTPEKVQTANGWIDNTKATGELEYNLKVDRHAINGPVVITAVAVKPVSDVALDKTEATLYEGASDTLTANVSPEDASNKNVTWTSSDETVASVDETGKITAVKEGTATITVTTEDEKRTATCVVTVKHKHVEEVVRGKAATCTEKGLTDGKKCSVCGEWILEQEEIPAKGHTEEVVKGKTATCTEKGLTDGKECSVCGEVLEAQKDIPALGHDYKDGKCTVCGAVDPDYKPTPVEPVSKFTGLANEADKDGNWWYYTDGKIDKNHTGVDQNKYGWWRVENGKVNFNAQSIYQNSFGWWKTTNGKVTFKENSIYQNQYGWWKCKDSKVDFTAQSIYQNQYGWWKTTDGKVTFKENGLFKNQYGTWKVENSKVNFNYNGTYQGKTIKNGKVQ